MHTHITLLIQFLPIYFGSDSQIRSTLVCTAPSTNDITLQLTKERNMTYNNLQLIHMIYREIYLNVLLEL